MADLKSKEIEIIVKEGTKKDGGKFIYYRAVQKNGKLIDCRFTKEVKNKPDVNCLIIVDTDKMNIDNSRKYPCLWIKKINDIIESNSKSKSVDDLF